MHQCNHCGLSDKDVRFGKRKVNGKEYLRFICNNCRKEYEKRFIRSQEGAERRRIKKRDQCKADRQNSTKRARYVVYDSRNWDRKHGLTNDLTIDIVERLITRPCSYCGEESLKMTLDRIDNTLGHSMGNVVASCLRCNLLRRDMPHEAWMGIVGAIRIVRQQGLFGEWTGDLHKNRAPKEPVVPHRSGTKICRRGEMAERRS